MDGIFIRGWLVSAEVTYRNDVASEIEMAFLQDPAAHKYLCPQKASVFLQYNGKTVVTLL